LYYKLPPNFVEENGALPKDQDFWYHLFNEASKWGLKVYEQDWLDIQFRLARYVLVLRGA
jgi:hypothetical protein